jgi:CRP-like cAMP-binding protein
MADRLDFGARLNLPLEGRTQALQKSTWGAEFSQDELERLASAMVARQMSQGETLFRESDNGDFMAILVDGMAKILKEGDDDLDHLIAEIGPGACVGEMALVDGGSRSASVIVSKESTLLVLTVDAFSALGERDPRIWGLCLQRFARTLSTRLRRTSEEMVDIITLTGYESESY